MPSNQLGLVAKDVSAEPIRGHAVPIPIPIRNTQSNGGHTHPNAHKPYPTPALTRRRSSNHGSAVDRAKFIAQSVPLNKVSHRDLHSVEPTEGVFDDDEIMDDGEFEDGDTNTTDGTGQVKRKNKGRGTIFKCEKCSKKYRHAQCLVKHRWEHSEHWKEASKLMLSKHAQVQMLEAAAILIAPSRSLPDDKSFWPAAVSSPESGLLGSDRFNIAKIHTGSVSSSYSSSFYSPAGTTQVTTTEEELISPIGDLDEFNLDGFEEQGFFPGDDQFLGGGSQHGSNGSNETPVHKPNSFHMRDRQATTIPFQAATPPMGFFEEQKRETSSASVGSYMRSASHAPSNGNFGLSKSAQDRGFTPGSMGSVSVLRESSERSTRKEDEDVIMGEI